MKAACGVSFLLLALAAVPGYAAASAHTNTEIRVFASEALARPLRQLGYEFEQQHPGVKIHYEFGASGVFVTGILQGIPPDLFLSSGSSYQDKLTDDAFVNLYSTVAHDHLVAATPCSPPPCCEAQGVVGTKSINKGDLIGKLMSQNVPLAIASPTLSHGGQMTMDMLKGINKQRPGALKKITDHAKEEMNPGLAAQDVVKRKVAIGIVYASQVAALRREGECVREIALPSAYSAATSFTVSVLNKSRFHFVDARRAKLDHELENWYLSKTGKRVLKEWGFSVRE